ncbi:MAG TPA: CDP-alcohol phosphatidyltransferase family protein [Candidatus Binataceae bacterium]|nr:CDP-alcohol phosphatidyltransferase family protein [Candidatus Binataceae bacterium]
MAVPAQPQSPVGEIEPPQTPRLGHLLNTPNFLTLCRVFSIPIFLSFLSRHRYAYAFYVFGAAALTDGLDGTVARWFDAKTELGAFLDPFADKLMLVSAFVALTIEGDFPGWLLSVVVIRDVVVVAGYLMLSFFTGERIPVRPSYLGKTSTFLQLGCVIVALGQYSMIDSPYFYALLYATTAATALSGLHYVYRGLLWLASREPELFR